MRPPLVALLLAACGSGSGNSGGGGGAPATAGALASGSAESTASAGAGSAAAPATPATSATPAAPAAAGPAGAISAADPAWPTPPGWRTEVIKFPLEFAPTIAHRGFEDIRFPPGFFDPASGDYWSYAFIWRTEDAARLDAAALGSELTTYFRGLIAAVDEKPRRITARDEIVARATPDGPSRFQLTAHVFDAFKTAAPLDLTGFAERRPCRSGALWVFVLAPQATKIRSQLEELARAARCVE